MLLISLIDGLPMLEASFWVVVMYGSLFGAVHFLRLSCEDISSRATTETERNSSVVSYEVADKSAVVFFQAQKTDR